MMWQEYHILACGGFQMTAYQQVTVNGQATEPDENDRVSQLARQLQDLRTKNSQLEQDLQTSRSTADTAGRTALHAQHQTFASQEVGFDNFIVAKQNEITALEQQKAALWSDGKFTEASALDTKLMSATADVKNAQRDKGSVTAERQRIERQAQAQPAQQQPPGEKYQGVHVNVKDWIGRHPLFETDQKFNSAALAGDAVARHHGAAPGSDRYFQLVEGEIERLTGRSAAGWHDRADTGADDQTSAYSSGNERQDERETVVQETVRNRQPGPAGKGSMSSMAAPSSRQVAGNQQVQQRGRLPTLTTDEREYALSSKEFRDYKTDADKVQAFARNKVRAMEHRDYGTEH